MLKPNWITKAISLVLTDKEVSNTNGVLRHSELARIWAIDEEGQPYEQSLYSVGLRLMERSDLSYQIEDDIPGTLSEQSDSSVFVLSTSYNAPFLAKTPPSGKTQLEMVYRFDLFPLGVMSFVHCAYPSLHSELALERRIDVTLSGSSARVELNPMQRETTPGVVWGIQPHNFFTILMITVGICIYQFHGLAVKPQRFLPSAIGSNIGTNLAHTSIVMKNLYVVWKLSVTMLNVLKHLQTYQFQRYSMKFIQVPMSK